jgi:glutamate-5-semialdehyde dehydrogenase
MYRTNFASDRLTEYLAPVLSVSIVNGIEKAVLHINTDGSGHTDAIMR